MYIVEDAHQLPRRCKYASKVHVEIYIDRYTGISGTYARTVLQTQRVSRVVAFPFPLRTFIPSRVIPPCTIYTSTSYYPYLNHPQ